VIPPEVFPAIVRLGLHVVTQPGLVAERGATYVREVDPDDLPHLYRCRSLIDAGIPVALSTDAPYTNADPWAAIRAAADRTLNPGERIDAHTGLRLFAATPAVVVGGPADLCLLHAPLADVLAAPSAGAVRATIAGGVVIHEAC
jgi:predicted amidohydrolase YtcJ